ncbi:MAG TPA: hypothetical protein EYG80_06030 [Flavobacteriaceae bacterium]|nr:hypothetical protein [Flavobacteriaceae bacterium]
MIRDFMVVILMFSIGIIPSELVSKNIDYYVSTEMGKDSNHGQSIDSPFKSIQKAANTIRKGGTVYIMEGIYHENIDLKHSGTKSNEILFTNYEDQLVVIDGDNKLPKETWKGLFSIFNQEYIKISGLNLKNSLYAGILIVDAKDISIENISTYNTFSSGLGVWGSKNILINNNKIEQACNGGTDECITVGESQYCIIKNNEVKNNGNPENGGEGIDIKDGSEYISVYNNHIHHLQNRTGIYVDGWDKNTTGYIKVYNNLVHDCNHTAMAIATERGGHLQNVSFYNNIIYNNSDVGILLGGWISHSENKADPTHTPISNVKFINNTLYNNGGGIVILNKDIKNLIIRNNICSFNSLKNIGDVEIRIENNNSESNIKVDHNLFQGKSANAFPLQKTSLPLFKNSLKYDFHLREGSPAINRGEKEFSPSIDFDWNEREDTVTDIGAYRY